MNCDYKLTYPLYSRALRATLIISRFADGFFKTYSLNCLASTDILLRLVRSSTVRSISYIPLSAVPQNIQLKICSIVPEQPTIYGIKIVASCCAY